jgi:endonuclease/exonuclease/phosphatase family metal-dependent hydrolase
MLKLKKALTKTFFILSIVFCLVYLLSCLTPYINPIYFSPFTFLALGFPFLLIGMLLLLIITFFCSRKKTWFVIVIIFFGFKNITSVIGFHFSKKFKQEREANTLRLLSWNVCDFRDNTIANDSAKSVRRQMLNFIKQSNADVLCFQDFSNYDGAGFRNNFKEITDSLHYRYSYYSIDNAMDISPSVHMKYGTIIFSKYPIIDSGKIKYGNEGFSEGLSYADIIFKKDTIRFYNTHLRSMQLKADFNFQTLDALSRSYIAQDSALLFHAGTFGRLKYFDSVHVQQTKIAKQQLNKTTKPYVFCADLNSVPSSYVYHHIKSGLQDAFLKNSFGFGGTYETISPTLRIDVTFLSNQFIAVQYYSPKLYLSDHFPLLTDIQLQ